jgi:predicted ABC-type ATPase
VSLFLEEATTPVREGLEDPNVLKAVFVVGSGGSGKSSVAHAMFAGMGLKVIDADRHLERFMKDAKLPLKDVGMHYDLFTKARDLRGKELRHHAQNRMGLIIDSTGWDYERVAEPAKKLAKLGYDTYMVYVKTSLDTAQARNKKRGETGGREVPPSYIDTAYYGAEKNLPRYIELFGKQNTFVVDNDKDVPAQTWKSVVAPALRRIGDKVAARPLKNPLGLAWIEREKAKPTLNDPKKSDEWPAPPPKPKPQWDLQPNYGDDWSYEPADDSPTPFWKAYSKPAGHAGKPAGSTKKAPATQKTFKLSGPSKGLKAVKDAPTAPVTTSGGATVQFAAPKPKLKLAPIFKKHESLLNLWIDRRSIEEAATNLPFFSTCVDWPKDKMAALHYLIANGDDSSLATVKRAANKEDWVAMERGMGYGRDFPMSKDFAIRFKRLRGFDLVYVVWSAIEHVFATPTTIDAVQKKARESGEYPNV